MFKKVTKNTSKRNKRSNVSVYICTGLKEAGAIYNNDSNGRAFSKCMYLEAVFLNV